MKKVIDGLKYDTETATEVYRETSGFPGDFRYRERVLYLSRNGRWFMYHRGGAMTDMGVSAGDNSLAGSENIEPISDSEAYDFLERNSSEPEALEALEKYFANEIEEA